MITDKLVCPVQSTETFSIRKCFHCRHFQQSFGGTKMSVSCRAQKTRDHKAAFQGAFFSDYIGRPDRVEVEAEKEACTADTRIKPGYGTGKTLGLINQIEEGNA